MSGRGVIKALSNMSIDEVSLVDRGANQHALISFAKRAPDVEEIFTKARKGGGEFPGPKMQMKATDEADIETHHGDDPADVVDEYVENDGKGDVGPDSKISGTKKTKGKPVAGRSAPAGSGHSARSGASDSSDDDVEQYGKSEEFEEEDDEVEKALSALGLFLDNEDDVEKGFGPPNPFQQQQPAPPQFGAPPAMQTVGAMPMGMGAPQAPPAAGPPSMGMPGPAMPGMGQQPMQLPQLPPEVVQYIQQLEQQLAQATKGSNPTDSSDSSTDSSSNSDSASDSSKKPFGKSEDYVDTNHFLEELSKALRDEDQVEAVSKAFQAQQDAFNTELSKRDQQLVQLTEVAKSERDLRLEREFIAKAAEFDVPVAAEELGPVLKRAAESLDLEDFSVLVKCLDAAGAADYLFGEVGKRGTADNADIFEMVEAGAEELAKSNGNLTGEQALAQVFEMNPEIYDQYTANQRANKL